MKVDVNRLERGSGNTDPVLERWVAPLRLDVEFHEHRGSFLRFYWIIKRLRLKYTYLLSVCVYNSQLTGDHTVDLFPRAKPTRLA